ncbi:hypothetical protein [Thalassobellus citreus]|uniref:hypothetical protein n=1 Tax=Thalassobellus citreus TaxID=3367752 RepID=UPI0037A3F1FB
MKIVFLILFTGLIFVNLANDQINNTKHYIELLKNPIDYLITKETKCLGSKLNLQTSQIEKLQSAVIIYYIELRKIGNANIANTINNKRKVVEWNFAEYKYLMAIKAFLLPEQEKIFDSQVYTKQTVYLAKRVFKRSLLM